MVSLMEAFGSAGAQILFQTICIYLFIGGSLKPAGAEWLRDGYLFTKTNLKPIR